MKALDFPLLADENILPEVINFLRKLGLDVGSIAEQGKFGLPDTDDIATGTTNAIIQFAVTTIKSLGYEYIKSRIGF